MNILITGANGYIGANLTKYLVNKGFNVYAVVIDKIEPENEWYSLPKELIIGDITNDDTLEKIANLDLDAVIHLVSLDHTQSEIKPIDFVEKINVNSTWKLIDTVVKKNKIQKFIYFSTIHVLNLDNSFDNEIFDEFLPERCRNVYGLTHLMSEKIVNYYNEKFDTQCINVRLSNSYGTPIFKSNACWSLVVNDFCKSAIEKGEITIASDGSALRDFINIKDVCLAIEVILSSDINKQNNLFHISSGKTHSIGETAEIVKHLFEEQYHKNISINYLQPQKTPTQSFKIENKRLKTIGFEPKYNLKKGILELFDYL